MLKKVFMKKVLLFLLAIVFLIGAVGCSEEQEPSPVIEPKEFCQLKNGQILFDSVENCDKFEIYSQSNLIASTKEDKFDVARAIIDEQIISYGKWDLNVKALDASGQVISGYEQDFNFEIKELNSNNFFTELNGEYKDSDYYLVSEDIDLYGQGLYNKKSVDGYQKVTFAAPIAESACFFITKTFTATIDGNGFSINALVDEHISWVTLPFVFGGVFYQVGESGCIKNTQIFLDAKYENKSRPNSSASFIYKHKGTIENCYIDGILRPFIRLSTDKCAEQGIDYDNAPYLNKTDEKTALISHALDGAVINGCVFRLSVYNLEDEKLDGGGAVAFSSKNVIYKDVCFISDNGESRFFNCYYQNANSQSESPLSANGVYFYRSLRDLVDCNGYKVNGELSRTPLYDSFNEFCFAGINIWNIDNGELYLNGKLVVEA